MSPKCKATAPHEAVGDLRVVLSKGAARESGAVIMLGTEKREADRKGFIQW
jgi:hypothetical protein